MLSSIFVAQGLETMQHPELVAPRAESVVQRMAQLVPALPADTAQAVRVNGAVQAAAGTMLGLGWFPRLSALTLAGTLVPTTLAGHRFWEVEDPKERKQQRIHFLKNMSMLGGLLIAAVDTDGSPSLAWRRRRASRAANARLAPATHAVASVSDDLGQAAKAVSEIVSAELPRVIRGTRRAADRLSSAAQTAAESARGAASDQLPRLAQAVTDSARTAADQVSQATQTALAASREAARQLAPA
jgi:putative oxidoreductase